LAWFERYFFQSSNTPILPVIEAILQHCLPNTCYRTVTVEKSVAQGSFDRTKRCSSCADIVRQNWILDDRICYQDLLVHVTSQELKAIDALHDNFRGPRTGVRLHTDANAATLSFGKNVRRGEFLILTITQEGFNTVLIYLTS
jgi:hypothetical protein